MSSKQEVKNIILALIRTYGRFPKISEISDAIDTNFYQTQLLLKALVKDGFLVMQGNWYRLSPEVLKQQRQQTVELVPTQPEPAPVPVPAPAPAPIPVQTPMQHAIEKITSITVLRIIMAIIGIGAMIMSFYYTMSWLLESLPLVLAGMLSLIMIAFSTFSFEVVLLFASRDITDRWWRWLVMLGFLLLWVVVAAYSISSTIAYQYNHYMQMRTEKLEAEKPLDTARTKWQLLQEQKEEVKRQIEEKREQLRQYTKLSGTISTMKETTRVWSDTQWRMRQLNNEIAALNKGLDQLLGVELTILEETPEATIPAEQAKIPDFFGWVAGVFNLDRDVVQFWVTLFPAAFVDLIAPAAMAIALFLRRRNKKRSRSRR